MFKCKFCNNTYNNKFQLGGHVVNCNNNPNKRKLLKDSYYDFPKKCKKCGDILPYEKRRNYFCNRSCFVSFNNIYRIVSTKQKQKAAETIRNTLQTSDYINRIKTDKQKRIDEYNKIS